MHYSIRMGQKVSFTERSSVLYSEVHCTHDKNNATIKYQLQLSAL